MLTAILGVLGAIVLIALAIYKYLDGNGDYWAKRGIETLKKGELASFWDRITLKISFIEYDLRCYQRFKHQRFAGIVEFREPVFYVTDLDLLRKILVKDFDHFVDRRKIEFGKDDELFNKMLTSKAGKEWKDLRSVMSPAFTTGKIRRMFQYFNVCADQFASYLRSSGKEGTESVNFQDLFGRYSTSVIASIVFGLETDVFTNEESFFRKKVLKLQEFQWKRVISFLIFFTVPKLAKLLNLSIGVKESNDFFVSIIEKNIKLRRENKEGRQDFLQLMLEAQSGQLKTEEKELDSYEKDAELQSSTGGSKKELAIALDDQTVIAQTFLFFSAGLDTIETLLTFVAYELALNPEIQDKLAEEVVPVLEEKSGDLSYEDVQGLPYLDMVISETLRHYPPAALTERQCTTDYRVPDSDFVIPKGMRVLIPINSIHHDERYYPNPDKFNPENFSAENKAKRHPYAYLPFGQGPRNCIAMRFALIEAKAAITHLVYNFKIEPSEKTQIPMKRSPKNAKAESLWLKFQPRNH